MIRLLKKIALCAGFTLALSICLLPIVNPDIFWHLLAGKKMLADFAFIRTDFMTWSRYGKPWLDFEWLVQIIYFLIWKSFGFTGLYFLKVSLLAAFIWVFWKIVRLYKTENIAFAALPIVAAGLIPNTDLRPENFSVLFFAVLILKMEKARLGLIDLKNKRFYAGIFFFFVLWVNLHAGYIYGLALIFFYFAGELFEESLPFIYGQSKKIKIKKSKNYLLLFAAAFSANFFNPYGYKIFKVMSNHHKYLATLQEYIKEWKPFDITGIYQWPYTFIFFASFLIILAKFLKTKKINFAHIGAMLFYAYYSINYSRLGPFFIIAASAYALNYIKDWKFLKSQKAFAAAGLIFLLAVLYCRQFVWTQYALWTNFQTTSYVAADFLKKNSQELKDLRMYNYWGWGGFLEFNLWPAYKTFIDGRYLFHSELEEIQNCQKKRGTWLEFIKKYDFRLMIVERDSRKVTVKHSFKNGKSAVLLRPAYLLYLIKKDWAVVEWDKRIIILVRRDSVDPDWLKKHEYKHLRPDDTLNLARLVLSGDIKLSKVRMEIKRYLKNHNPSFETSLNGEMESWSAELEKLCRETGKC